MNEMDEKIKLEERAFTVRRKLFARAVFTGGLLLFFWTFTLIVGGDSYDDSLADAVAVPAVIGLCIFVLSVLWFSCIRINACGITVENGFISHFIPWENVYRIDLKGGLRISMKDDVEVRSIQFGESLIGELTGYRSHRSYVKIMRNCMREFKERNEGEGVASGYLKKYIVPWGAIWLGLSSFLFLYVVEIIS